MKKRMILITEAFPYGKGEKSFIMPELPYLQREYEVSICSRLHQTNDLSINYKTQIDDSIKVYNYDYVSKWKLIQKGIFFIFDRETWKEYIRIIKKGKYVFGRLIQASKFSVIAYAFFRTLEQQYELKGNVIIMYSYWNDISAYASVLCKKKYKNIVAISRIHGGDLYEERAEYQYQPFKTTMNQYLNGIVFACENAQKYYVETYIHKLDLNKLYLSRLGVGRKEIGQVNNKKKFLLVSCSFVIPLKRIDLIIEALALLCDEEIVWYHFGDGTELERLAELAARKIPSNIQYKFQGYVDNADIIKFYSDNQVDCFITTSMTEGGCPVAIQEALSFGVPVIGTAVGGIKETIEKNGIYLSQNPDAIEVADAIRRVYYLSNDEKENLRKKSIELWGQRFDAHKNSMKFMEILNEVISKSNM